jgi:hypothetical protein
MLIKWSSQALGMDGIRRMHAVVFMGLKPSAQMAELKRAL